MLIVLVVSLISVILLPGFEVGDHLTLRLETFLVPLAVAFWLLAGADSCARIVSQAAWPLLFAVIVLMALLSGMIQGESVVMADLTEIAKPLFGFAFVIVGARSIRCDGDMRTVQRVVLVCLVLSALVGFAQYWNLWNVNGRLTPLYATTQLRGVEVGHRIVGTTPNPNVFATMQSVLVMCAIYNAMRRPLGQQLVYFVLAGVGLFATVLSASRGTLLALGLALTYALSLGWRHAPDGKQGPGGGWGVATPLLLVTLVAMSLALMPEQVSSRMLLLTDIASDESSMARLDNWQDHYERVGSHIWFLGAGPLKREISYIMDNEWLLILFRYGIVGVGVFTLWMLAWWRALARRTHLALGPAQAEMAAAMKVVFVVLCLVMLTAGWYHSMQLMPFIFLLTGTVLYDPPRAGQAPG
jgi:hypothetical protein